MLILQQAAEPLPPQDRTRFLQVSPDMTKTTRPARWPYRFTSTMMGWLFSLTRMTTVRRQFVGRVAAIVNNVRREFTSPALTTLVDALDFKGLFPFDHINEFVSVRRCRN